MALKAVLATVDGLPAEIAKEYKKQTDGSFRLDVEKVSGFELADTEGLLSALSKERLTASEATNRLKAFGKITPEEAVAATAEFAKLGGMTLDQKTELAVKAREGEIIKRMEGEKATLAEKVTKLTSQTQRMLVDTAARQAILEEGGNVTLLLPHVTSQMKVFEDGDTLVARVIGPDGQPRIGGVKDGQSFLMDPKQLITEMKTKPDYLTAFTAKKSGSGANGTANQSHNRTGQQNAGGDTSRMTPQQKLAHARATGQTGTEG